MADEEWGAFRERVAKIGSHQELKEFLRAEMPPHASRARRYFTSLQQFESTNARPQSATAEEWALYRGLWRRLVARGDLKAAALEAFKELGSV